MIALVVVALGTACSSSATVGAAPAAQVHPQNVETSTATESPTTGAGVDQAEESGTAEPTPTLTVDAIPVPSIEADVIAELAAIEDVDIDPKRVADRVALGSTWWGLGSDVYPGEATPAGPIPDIADLTHFCNEGHLAGSPQSRTRAVRDWTAQAEEYRRVEVSASAMLDVSDATNSMDRDRLLLQHCAGVVTAGIVMDVVDAVHGRLMVLRAIDSDFVLVSASFSAGSLVVRVSASGDVLAQEQLIADVEYGMRAAVEAVDAELERLGAVAQLLPDVQEELSRLEGFCRGHHQWETSVGLPRTPLEYFEDVVGYFDKVQPPEEVGEQFENFQRANAEMLEAVGLEPNLTNEELGEHPTWIEVRERYNFAEALDAVWEFGRETC